MKEKAGAYVDWIRIMFFAGGGALNTIWSYPSIRAAARAPYHFVAVEAI